MFSLREDLNLETSKLFRIRSSILKEGWQDEIMEKLLGEIYGVMSMVDVGLDTKNKINFQQV